MVMPREDVPRPGETLGIERRGPQLRREPPTPRELRQQVERAEQVAAAQRFRDAEQALGGQSIIDFVSAGGDLETLVDLGVGLDTVRALQEAQPFINGGSTVNVTAYLESGGDPDLLERIVPGEAISAVQQFQADQEALAPFTDAEGLINVVRAMEELEDTSILERALEPEVLQQAQQLREDLQDLEPFTVDGAVDVVAALEAGIAPEALERVGVTAQQQRDIEAVRPFRDEEGQVDLVAALEGGVAPEVLERRFGNQAVQQAQQFRTDRQLLAPFTEGDRIDVAAALEAAETQPELRSALQRVGVGPSAIAEVSTALEQQRIFEAARAELGDRSPVEFIREGGSPETLRALGMDAETVNALVEVRPFIDQEGRINTAAAAFEGVSQETLSTLGVSPSATPFFRDAQRLRELTELFATDQVTARRRIAERLGFDPDLVDAQFADAAGRHPDSRQVMEEARRLRDEMNRIRNKYESTPERIFEAAERGIALPPIGAGVSDRPQTLAELQRTLGLEQLPDPNSAEFVRLVQRDLGLSPQETASLVRDLADERVAREARARPLGDTLADVALSLREGTITEAQVAQRLGSQQAAQAVQLAASSEELTSSIELRDRLGLPETATIEEVNAAIERQQARRGAEFGVGIGGIPEEDLPGGIDTPREQERLRVERFNSALAELETAGLATRNPDGSFSIDAAAADVRGFDQQLRDVQISAETARQAIAQRREVAEAGRLRRRLERATFFDQVERNIELIKEQERAQTVIQEEAVQAEAVRSAASAQLGQALLDAQDELESTRLQASRAGDIEQSPAFLRDRERVREIGEAIRQVEAGALTENEALAQLGLNQPEARQFDELGEWGQFLVGMFGEQAPPEAVLPPEEWSPDAETRQLYQTAQDFQNARAPAGTWAPADIETAIVGPNPELLTVDEVVERIEAANETAAALEREAIAIDQMGVGNIATDPETGITHWIGPEDELQGYLERIEDYRARVQAYESSIADLPELETSVRVKSQAESLRNFGVDITPVGTVIHARELRDSWGDLNTPQKVFSGAATGVSALGDVLLVGSLVAKPLAAATRAGIGVSIANKNAQALRGTVATQRAIVSDFLAGVERHAQGLRQPASRMVDDFVDHATLSSLRRTTAERLAKAEAKVAGQARPDGTDILNVRVLGDRLRGLDEAMLSSRQQLENSSREFAETVRQSDIFQDSSRVFYNNQETSLGRALNDLPGDMVRQAEADNARAGVNKTIAEAEAELQRAETALAQAERRYEQAQTVSLSDLEQLSALRQQKVALESQLNDLRLGDLEALNRERLIVQNDVNTLQRAAAQGRDLTERESIETQRFRSVSGLPAAEQRLQQLSESVNRQLRNWDDILGEPLNFGGGRTITPLRPPPVTGRGELAGFTRGREVPFLTRQQVPTVALGGLGQVIVTPPIIGAVEAPEAPEAPPAAPPERGPQRTPVGPPRREPTPEGPDTAPVEDPGFPGPTPTQPELPPDITVEPGTVAPAEPGVDVPRIPTPPFRPPQPAEQPVIAPVEAGAPEDLEMAPIERPSVTPRPEVSPVVEPGAPTPARPQPTVAPGTFPGAFPTTAPETGISPLIAPIVRENSDISAQELQRTLGRPLTASELRQVEQIRQRLEPRTATETATQPLTEPTTEPQQITQPRVTPRPEVTPRPQIAIRPELRTPPSLMVPLSLPPAPPTPPRPPLRPPFRPPGLPSPDTMERDDEGQLKVREVVFNRGIFDSKVDLTTQQTDTFKDLPNVPEVSLEDSLRPVSFSTSTPEVTRVKMGFHDMVLDEQGEELGWIKPKEPLTDAVVERLRRKREAKRLRSEEIKSRRGTRSPLRSSGLGRRRGGL